MAKRVICSWRVKRVREPDGRRSQSWNRVIRKREGASERRRNIGGEVVKSEAKWDQREGTERGSPV